MAETNAVRSEQLETSSTAKIDAQRRARYTTGMIGRILFLSGAAFLAYRYITKSNRKARELRQAADTQQVLPPAAETPILESARVLPPSAATEEKRASRTVIDNSPAAESSR